MATVVIINGQPAVGKTTLMKRLAADLNIGYIAKDDIKELYGDTLHVKSEDVDAYYYGDASVMALYATLNAFSQSSKTFIVENAFWYELATKRFNEIIKKADSVFLQIYVTCNESEKVRRFNERIANGSRHSIHPDSVYTNVDPDVNAKKYKALDLPEIKTIHYDSTSPMESDYANLVKWLKKEIG